MPNPTNPYVIGGTAYKGAIPGFSKIQHTVDVSSGGINSLDIYFGGGDTALSQELTITVYRSGVKQGSDTTTSNSTTGKWMYDLLNLNYADGDLVEISGSTALDTVDEDKTNFEPALANRNSYHEDSKSFKRILVDSIGNEVSKDNPLPVLIIAPNLDFVDGAKTYTYNGDGTAATESIEVDGVTWQRTFTYDGSAQLLTRSAWVKQ